MSLPNQMKVVEIAAAGGPEMLRAATRPLPQPGPGQILLKLAYAGVNRPDALQRAGAYPPPKDASDLPGLEGAGEVVALGEGITRWKIGDQLCALLPGGGYAEYAICHADHALPIPGNLSLAQAAALPETFFTVWSNVFMRGGLQAGERFLLHGGSSGIGTTAIQLAHAFGAEIFATAGSAEKCAACEKLGATAINYREDDFVALIKEAGGADLILDMVGGDYIARNLKCLKNDGRLVNIAFLQAPVAEVNFAQIMVKRLTVTGSTLRPQSDTAKAKIADELRTKVWPLLEKGKIAPVMDREFALEQAAAAHERMESSAHIGKMVLRVVS